MKIYDKYPEMFRNCYCGIDIPTYWEPIVDRLCGLIKAYRTRNNLPPMEIHQIKEKFAGLRLYNNGEFPRETTMIKYADLACKSICDVCQGHDNVETVNNNNWLINKCKSCRTIK